MLDTFTNLIIKFYTALLNLVIAAGNLLSSNSYLLGFCIICLVAVGRSFKLGKNISSTYKK